MQSEMDPSTLVLNACNHQAHHEELTAPNQKDKSYVLLFFRKKIYIKYIL
jgi:hypothetical protein